MDVAGEPECFLAMVTTKLNNQEASFTEYAAAGFVTKELAGDSWWLMQMEPAYLTCFGGRSEAGSLTREMDNAQGLHRVAGPPSRPA